LPSALPRGERAQYFFHRLPDRGQTLGAKRFAAILGHRRSKQSLHDEVLRIGWVE
jgi:hypothetical protein